MVGLEDSGHLSELQNFIIASFEDARDWMHAQDEWPAPLIDAIRLTGAVEYRSWGEGTAESGEDPLELMLFIEAEGIDIQQFFDNTQSGEGIREFFAHIEDAMDAVWEPSEELADVFPGASFTARPNVNRDDSLQLAIIQREPHRAVDIFSDEIITVEANDIRRQRISAEVAPEESDTPTDILQFSYLDDLEELIIDTFHEAVDELEGSSNSSEPEYSLFYINSITVGGEWGNGTGQHGEDPLQVVIDTGFDQPSGASQVGMFTENYLRDIGSRMEELIQPFFVMDEWFSGYSFQPLRSSLFQANLIRQIRSNDRERAFDLTNRTLYHIEEGELVAVPVEYGPQEEEPPEQLPEEDVEEEKPEQPAHIRMRERLADEFPDIEPELRQYAVEVGRLEIAAGKETKSVEPRQHYEFELEMAEQGDAETTIPRDIMEGIGGSMARGRFGREDPPASFPRTGQYIKYHLLYQGPSYILEMYNDMVIYSGFISHKYQGQFRCGKYDSFREFIYMLEQVHEREIGPQLIKPLTQEEAQARDLDTMAKIPTGDGMQDAPWLESRQYFEVIKDNLDHPAWNNVYQFVKDASQEA